MRILFINLPPASTKKSGNKLYWLQASMNLGLLAVASSASRAGHEVDVYDWLGEHQYRLLDELPGVLSRNPPDLVGLSMPSGYGEQYCAPITEQVKRLSPGARIVAGGQYHAGMRPRELLARFPLLDAVATGDGEELDWEALRGCDLAAPPAGIITRESAVLHGVPPGVSRKELAPEYRFKLLRLEPRSYAPSIEIARGCPFTCSFCSLSGAPAALELASRKTIQDQLQFWLETWPELERVPIYFECPVFFCTSRNVENYAECLAPFKGRIEWRTQCRVDSVTPEVLPKLHQMGLRMLDVGLESASPRMLELMKKTEGSTEQYLRRAQILIDRAAACGVGVKLNILLYAGENEQSAGETESFIMRNRDKLAGIAAAAAIEFPGSDLGNQLGKLQVQFGTQRREDARVSSAGIYPLDLSHEFPLERAREWCLNMTRSVTTAESYYRLKRIGYFRPDFSFSEFMQVVHAADPDSLPFTLTPDGNATAKAQGPWDMAQWDQLR
ncbi:B12-binding domain-containing radical SAM protein [Myxococcus virescens]|uniref:B12-binding domain-containing radical SAM protein n=1 Tax=Myxococcus virescens TaxID=83456 RepID=UPI003DA2E5CD